MKMILASGNRKKLAELSRILEPMGFNVIPKDEAGVDFDPEENGATFAENAKIKAEAICKAVGEAAVADDSGLCVDALNGAPGIYSARYAGENASDSDRIDKLLSELAEVSAENRTARFVSAVCICFPDGSMIEAEGVCEGMIAFERRGNGGFGYDPVFLVGEKSFAELSAEEKDALSHRGKALRALQEKLEKAGF
ncbi:MAG: XTP/dITP diphosphatase [Ruminococcaceae bacterium]|nr:XTP/dITP diphosphatase [Oscillospiraceae bacterium]